MIVCLYGMSCAAFVEPVARDLYDAVRALGAPIELVPLEAALAEPWRWQAAERLYVLPYEPPRRLPPRAAAHGLLGALFPRAATVNSPAVHELCCDALATTERLLARGVVMPDSLITSVPDEARAFVDEHEHAILKAPHCREGGGAVVVFFDDAGTLVGEANDRRYVVELQASGGRRRLAHGVLACPPPFYLQRLVAHVDRRGALGAAQVLRAYIVDGRVVFWSERYRDRHRRPSDFIVTSRLGARYRLLREVSDEAIKLALRAADVLGVRIGAVDLIRSGSEGPYVIAADTDGQHLFIDRQFKYLPEFRSAFDFDAHIALALATPAPEPAVRRTRA
jgi:hypothetical protein